MESYPYTLWLTNIPGLGSVSLTKLIDQGKSKIGEENNAILSSEEVAHLIYDMKGEKMASLWKDIFGEGKKSLSVMKAIQERQNMNPLEQWESFCKKDITMILREDMEYPEAFRFIDKAPFALFRRGQPIRKSPMVAVVGARACSPYGSREAKLFGQAFGLQQVGVVSGLAYGVDGIAQNACLDAGGYSIGILGCGVDYCYPADHQELYDRLLDQGTILSEYPPGTMPMASLFPARNRLISALASVILVVEARSRSGTIITVDYALEQGKEVFAIPGNIDQALSYGCNRLIKQGAGIATEPGDILEALGLLGMREQRTIGTMKKQQETDGCKKGNLETDCYKKGQPEKEDGIEPAIGNGTGQKTGQKEQKRTTLELPPIEAALYECLSYDKAKNMDHLMEEAEVKMGHRMHVSDGMQALMMLVIKGYALEYATGLYVRK